MTSGGVWRANNHAAKGARDEGKSEAKDRDARDKRDGSEAKDRGARRASRPENHGYALVFREAQVSESLYALFSGVFFGVQKNGAVWTNKTRYGSPSGVSEGSSEKGRETRGEKPQVRAWRLESACARELCIPREKVHIAFYLSPERLSACTEVSPVPTSPNRSPAIRDDLAQQCARHHAALYWRNKMAGRAPPYPRGHPPHRVRALRPAS